MQIIACEPARHADAVREIFNHAIADSTAVYEYEPRSAATIDAWFEDKRRGGWPVIGIESDTGALMGFATFGPFRPRPAYRYTVEHTVHVAPSFLRRGVGQRLLRELIVLAHQRGAHTMVGVIDSGNQASIALHEKLGFTRAGVIRHAGRKFDRWLDVVLYQLILESGA